MKKGFTLAEILITLGIIGIVSAVTIPVLIENHRKNVTVTRLKKAYTTISQAMLLSVSENGDYINWDDPQVIGDDNYFNKYLLPYIKDAVISDNKTKCDYYGKGGLTAYTGFINLDGSLSNVDPISAGRLTLLLPDGTTVIYFLNLNNDYARKNNWIYIDINGGDKPNTFGKDVFAFERDANAVIVTRCKGKTRSYVDKDCSSIGSGLCCSEKIILDSWKIKY